MQYQQIYGVFDSVQNAERAIAALKDHGAEGNEVSVVRRSDGKGMAGVEEGGSHGITVTTADDAAAGALKGGAVGIALGVLAGAILLTIPGVGPILAAGPLWAAFGAAAATGAAGAALGGVVGYLVDQGVPSHKAHLYADAIQRGDMLVSVRSHHINAGDVSGILGKYGATEIGSHVVGDTANPATEPALTGYAVAAEQVPVTDPEPLPPVAAPSTVPLQDALTQDALAQEALTPDTAPMTLSPITPVSSVSVPPTHP